MLTCFQGYLYLYKCFEKLTEITISFALCQIKSHFFLIPFLICFSTSYSSQLPAFRRELVYNTTNPNLLSSIFSNFFYFFLKKFYFLPSLADSLYILPHYSFYVNCFFNLFSSFFRFFEKSFFSTEKGRLFCLPFLYIQYYIYYLAAFTRYNVTFSPFTSTSFTIAASATTPFVTETAKTSSAKFPAASTSATLPSA